MKNLVVLTGAGMSAESGISTFRDAGGLWDRYPVEQVDTPDASGAEALASQGADVGVGERVEDIAPVAPEFNQVRLLECAQLVRHRGLRGFGRFGDVCHAELAAHEGVKDLDTRGVAEDLEQVGEVVEKLLVGKVLGRAGGGDHWLGGLGVGFRFINADAHCNILSYEHTLK